MHGEFLLIDEASKQKVGQQANVKVSQGQSKTKCKCKRNHDVPSRKVSRSR